MKSTRAIRALLRAEDPDLVVFTGDQITGNNICDNATKYWQQVVAPCQDQKIPWAAVFGNHDTMALEDERLMSRAQAPFDKTRPVLMSFDASHSLSCSAAGHLPDGKAVSNFVIDITGPGTQVNTTVVRLYFFDTGGGDYDEVVYADQVAWFENVSGEISSTVPAFAYFHIPLREYVSAWGQPGCVGMNDNGGVTPVAEEHGLFNALTNAGVLATFVGHNHGNDWCCPSPSGTGPILCFGRHSGYGGYGKWDRGARVLGLQLRSGEVIARSWVRMEHGDVIHEVNISESRSYFL